MSSDDTFLSKEYVNILLGKTMPYGAASRTHQALDTEKEKKKPLGCSSLGLEALHTLWTSSVIDGDVRRAYVLFH